MPRYVSTTIAEILNFYLHAVSILNVSDNRRQSNNNKNSYACFSFLVSNYVVNSQRCRNILLNVIDVTHLTLDTGLQWLRGTLEVHDEMDEMRAENEAMKVIPRVTLREMLSNPMLKTPLAISVMIMLCQQLSGINAVSHPLDSRSTIVPPGLNVRVLLLLPAVFVRRSCSSPRKSSKWLE